MQSEQTITRQSFKWLDAVTTRWHDNDAYGHVNNVTYYSFFDTAVNRYLIEQGKLNIHTDKVIAFVVNSQCNYYAPVAYPDALEVGVNVQKLGNSSVVYHVAVFHKDQPSAVAIGSFTHVFVDRETNQSVPIPAAIRTALAAIQA